LRRDHPTYLRIVEIGKELATWGGIDLMRWAYYAAGRAGLRDFPQSMWNGIGGWHD
jgi:hypothetical protein